MKYLFTSYQRFVRLVCSGLASVLPYALALVLLLKTRSCRLKSSVITLESFSPVCWFVSKAPWSLLSLWPDSCLLRSASAFADAPPRSRRLPSAQGALLRSPEHHGRFRRSGFSVRVRGGSLVRSAQRSKPLHQSTASHRQKPFKNPGVARYRSVRSQRPRVHVPT